MLAMDGTLGVVASGAILPDLQRIQADMGNESLSCESGESQDV